MVSNITYKFSAFSDYSMIKYNKNDVVSILSKFKDIEFSPIAIQELLPLGMSSQRMQFLAQNGFLIITIGYERIDIQMTSDRKEGFTSDEMVKCKEDAELYMGKLFEIFEGRVALPYRLAWFTSYVYFDQSIEEKTKFRDKFLKEIDYFKKERLDEMVARYGATRYIKVANKDERLNVLLTVNRHIIDNGAAMEVDGYKADFDINTWQENRVGRFDKATLNDFINKAFAEQEKLRKEILP